MATCSCTPACPLDDDGTLKEVDIYGTVCSGKKLYDEAQLWVRRAFESEDPVERERGRDLIRYLWLGPGSPLFAKSKMATFEIYLCKDKAARKEVKNAFYLLLDEAEPYERIFEDFGLDPARAALSADMCRSRPRTVRIPSRRTDASSASTAACRRPTARRPGLAGYTLTRTDEHFTLYAIQSFDKGTQTLVTEAREIPPR